MKILRKPDLNSTKGGWEEIAYYVIVAALSYLASALLKKKVKTPLQDSKPTTLTIRGSYTTWVCGIRSVGPVFAWAGDRFYDKRKPASAKGGDTPEITEYYESAWHILSVGPCDALYSISQAGSVFFSGPLTRTSHPSGTTVDLAGIGSFTIYWGEATQPINTFLGAATRVGISSRWPNCCYVVWINKKLGSTANWPILTYEIERRPSLALLTGSSSWYNPTEVIGATAYPITGFVSSSNPNTGYLEIKGDFLYLDVGQSIELTGNSLPDGFYTINKVQRRPYPAYPFFTQIFLATGTLGANGSGTIQLSTLNTDNGANIAHALAELLFAAYPLGAELPTGDPEPWDLPSLEALGIEAEASGWKASLVSVDGDSVAGLLGTALQDHGVLLPLDTATGHLKFQSVRLPVGVLPNISEDMESNSLPEIESVHAEKTADIVVYSFTDRDHNYSEMTIAVSDDGQVSYTRHARSKIVGITSTVTFDTAASLTELRSQEELAGVGVFRLQAGRGARKLIPGQAIIDSQFDEVLRVIGVSIDPLSEIVSLSVLPDFYGGRKSDYLTGPGGGQTVFRPTQVNPESIFLEVPEQLLSVEQMFILAPSIRAHSEILRSLLYLSRDDVTYTFIGPELAFCAGGVLDATVSASTLTLVATGPTFTVEGPDIGAVVDLSADPTNFGLGRQLVVIQSSAGVEIGYVQKITSISSTQFRLDGWLRARFDTRKIAHAVGDAVFIFQNTTLNPFQDLLLVPASNLYLKAQPLGTLGTISLSTIPPFFGVLRGKGLVPIDVEGFRNITPFPGSATYRTGDTVSIAWSWSSAISKVTGAGFQNAGTAIGTPTLKGFFLVELLTSASVFVSSLSLTVANVTYVAATLAAAPISNGNFKVRVTQIYNGYSSTPVVYSITHVT